MKLSKLASKYSLRYLVNKPVNERLNVDESINVVGDNRIDITPPFFLPSILMRIYYEK
ncbi:hypothetical protein VroAM7_51010 (plasmid) [Vibrio rotiferianus]|uniref:Uncharacterized protein n=1 Tax=Vibrio rotiferianus TaxID=190895 RepID=A0A510IH72_9VIBR|nr:hypothetical protein VroAM7_51010 [Vibrio rotiferianus]